MHTKSNDPTLTPPFPRHLSTFVLLTVGTALFLASCSGSGKATESSPLPSRFPNHSVDQLQNQIAGRSDTIHSYTAKARVTVQTPSENRSFNAVVRHRRADSLFMRVSLFGIEGGRILLTPDSVFFYDKRNTELRVGPLEEVQQLFPAPVSSDDFFENMLGLLAPSRTRDWSLQADSSLYYVSRSNDRERYAVDPTRWRVVRYEKRTANGSVVQKRVFSDFRSVDGLLLPAQLIFQQPAADLRAVVTYKEMTLNPTRSDLSFPLNVPSQVPRKPF